MNQIRANNSLSSVCSPYLENGVQATGAFPDGPEIDEILAGPNWTTRLGRRNYAFLPLAARPRGCGSQTRTPLDPTISSSPGRRFYSMRQSAICIGARYTAIVPRCDVAFDDAQKGMDRI